MRAPIYEALKKYAEEKNILLHMPGHKGGRGLAAPELNSIGSLDFTEVPGLDDLHVAEDIIMEAQNMAARAWGAAESLFLVNGATSGIHSLLLAVGGQVLIPRNAHRSVLGGLILSGAEPVFIDCEIDPLLQIAVSVAPEKVAVAVRSHPDLKAALIVSPTYFGTASRMGEIAGILDAGGIPLLVDEAHGGHFAFHPDYPQPALRQGAKAVVHGLHKTLPVLTQAGMLHLASDFPWANQVRSCYDLLTTTSPSYPLMASLDMGRAIMEDQGQALLERAMFKSDQCCLAINKIGGLSCRLHRAMQTSDSAAYDPLKILVEIVDLDIDGPEMARLLRKQYGIQVEMAAGNYVLAIFSPFNADNDWDQLAKALDRLAASVGRTTKPAITPAGLPPIPTLAMTPRQAFLSERKTVIIEESIGLTAAESVAAYPPGIPCLWPGQVITHEVVEYLKMITSQGAVIHGLRDQNRQTIDVV